MRQTYKEKGRGSGNIGERKGKVGKEGKGWVVKEAQCRQGSRVNACRKGGRESGNREERKGSVGEEGEWREGKRECEGRLLDRLLQGGAGRLRVGIGR